MSIFLTVIFVIGLILLANVLAAARNDTYNKLFDVLLFFMNAPLALLGLGFMLIPPAQLAALQVGPALLFPNPQQAGAVFLFMAFWGAVASLRPVRRLLARALPFDPTSPVHALALVLSGYLVGNTLLTLTQGGLEALAQTAVTASVIDVVVQQMLFALVAIFGAGLLIRRNWEGLRVRLGLERPTWPHLRLGLRWIVILVAAQWATGLVWQWLEPEQAELLEGITTALLGDFDTVGKWLVLGLATGIGEELLFRGALQPAFGLWFTSILFAVAHVQYGFTLITLFVFVIGIVLGYIRRQTNTTTTIIVHAGYNFILGLLALLATYLEQFVG